MALRTPTQEEREIIVRDKAAREGLTVPDEVVRYIAEHRTSDTTLKGALVDLAAYAYRRQMPITLQMAEYRLEGIRPGMSAKHAAEQTRELDPIEGSPITFRAVSEEPTTSSTSYGLPSFLTGGASPMAEALSEEHEIVLEEVPEPTFLAGTITEQLRADRSEDVVEVAEEPVVDEPELASAIDATPLDEPIYEPIELEEPYFEDPFEYPSYSDSDGDLIEPEPEPAPEPQPAPEPEPAPESKPAPEPEPVDWSGTEVSDDREPTLFDEHVMVVAPSNVAMPSDSAYAPATVYFAPIKTNQKRSFVERAGIALKRAGLDEVVSKGDIVAIKIHVGEAGNTAFVNPIYVREVVSLIKALGGKPFLTDANTLYSGQRKNAVDHVACAIHNGFSYATIEAPFIVADGLVGTDWVEVQVDGKHCEKVRMGSAAVEADAMVVISHVKGHGVAGFGGAIKNVGMGLGSRAAKQRMHSDVQPTVDAEKCTQCSKCIKWCPVQAIHIDERTKSAVIDHEICYGCGECVAACNYEAIAISWQTDPNSLQEKMVEHAAGIVDGKPDKMIYLSFLTNVTPECDCWSYSDAPIVGDIGLLASRDMIAIDQASYDLVVEAVGNANSDGAGMGSGTDKFAEITGTDGTRAIEYGEEFGLGTRRYEIIEIG